MGKEAMSAELFHERRRKGHQVAQKEYCEGNGREALGALVNALVDTEEKLRRSRAEVAKQAKDIEFLKQQLAITTRERDQWDGNYCELRAETDKLEAENNELWARVKELEGENAELREKLDGQRG